MRTILVTAAVAAFLLSAPALAGKKPDAKVDPAKEAAKPADMPPEMESHTLVLLQRGAKAAEIPEAELAKLQEQHLAHLFKLADEGKIVLVGPFSDQTDETLRGGCIYSVPLAEAVKLAEQDPMVKAGRLKVTAMTWWVGKGYVAFPKAKK